MRKWEVPESWVSSECWDDLPLFPVRCQANCLFPPGSQFWVTVQRTEAAERCGLHGSYVLRVEAERLTLLAVGTQNQILEPLLSWPYTLLRRYGRDKVGMLSWRVGFLGPGLWAGWGGAGQEGGKLCLLKTLFLPSP